MRAMRSAVLSATYNYFRWQTLMSNDAELKPGDLIYCDSDGTCSIHLGFIPDTMFIDAEGNYVAEDRKGNRHEGIVPYGQ